MQEYISSILRSDESNQWMDQMGSSNRDLPRRIWDLHTGTSQDKDGIFILGPAGINMGSSNPSVWVNLQGKWGKFRPFVPLSNSQNSSLHHLEVLWGLHGFSFHGFSFHGFSFHGFSFHGFSLHGLHYCGLHYKIASYLWNYFTRLAITCGLH